MAYTLQSTKSNGDNISRAEAVTLRTNLEWFRTPPAYRLYDSDGGETLTPTIDTLVWATGHYEWREGGGGDPDNGTYNTGTAGAYVNVGDVAAGVWINGAMVSVAKTATGVAADSARRIVLRRGDGSTWTEMADTVAENVNEAYRSALHVSGLGNFSTSTDRVEVRGQQSGGVGTTLEVLQDRRWGVRVGSSSTLQDNFAAARPVSDTNDELTRSWNQLRLNHARIERRPSAQKSKTGSDQAITASTETLVTLGATDWGSDTDMVPIAVFPNLMIAQQTGVYLVHGQITFDGYNDGTGFAIARIKKNASAVIATTNAAGVNSYETTVAVSDVVELVAGDYISLYAEASANRDVQAGRSTYLTMTLVSSDNGVSPGRQVFDRMPAPATWPNISAMSSDHLPAGTLRVLSDLTDRQWHRPAMKARLTDPIDVAVNGGWTDVDVDEVILDYTDLESTHGYRLTSGGALMLPWAGIWLVGAIMGYASKSTEGANKGGAGTRGMRLALGKNRAAGATLGRAMNASTHGWTQSMFETVVVNADAGQEVRLQARIDNANDFGSIPVQSATLWAVELGEGITRDAS